MAEAISSAAKAEDAQDKLGAGKVPSYTAGFRDGWAAVGPPHKQRFLRYSRPEGDAAGCGALLDNVRQQLFCSTSFARLLRKFITVGMLGHQSQVSRCSLAVLVICLTFSSCLSIGARPAGCLLAGYELSQSPASQLRLPTVWKLPIGVRLWLLNFSTSIL